MRLLTFVENGCCRPGLIPVDGLGVVDLSALFGARELLGPSCSVLSIIEGGADMLAALGSLLDASTPRRALDELALAAPIPRPRKNIFCVGRNYMEHIREGGAVLGGRAEKPDHPTFFTKAATAVIGAGQPIVFNPHVSQEVDYEVELGVIIGKEGRDIPRQRAMEHVFGYTVVNDVSARDLQFRHGQWFKGKSLDSFCPLGPWIVTPDELPDLEALELSLSVNGQTRQTAKVAEMIFPVDQLIASLSQGMTLEPGDIIATGTPAGVGFSRTPPLFLSDGDVVRCAITGLGVLENVVVAREG